MTNWYAFKWVCGCCKAIHYWDAKPCRRCGSSRMEKRINDEKLARNEVKKSYNPQDVPRETGFQPSEDLDDMISDILGD